MQTTARHWLCLAAAALCLAGLAGCTTQPLTESDGSPRVVVRTPGATVWATPEAALAASAPSVAAARPAAARPVAASGGAVGSTAAGPARSGGPAAEAAVAAPSAARAVVAPDPASAAALAQTLTFDFDRFDIKDEFRPLLEGHAQVLTADPGLQLVIEGHADERGGAEYNLALGQKRAQAVVRALVLLGVAEARMEAVSFGDTRPVARGSTEEAWARNRRAEIKRR